MTFSEIFGSAKFIAPSDGGCTAPYMLCDLPYVSDDVKGMTLTITGLGLFEVYVNGIKVSEDIFTPASSDYHKRDFSGHYGSFREGVYRTYVLKYDLLPYLKAGNNRLAVLLGKGWYCINGNHDEGTRPYGNVKMCCRVDTVFGDGRRDTLFSSDGFKWAKSFICDNDLFYGESQDLLGFDGSFLYPENDISSLENTVELEEFDSNFQYQTCPSDRVIRTLKPVLVKDFGNYKVYDNGENITGYVRLRCDKAGQKVKLIHTEELDEDKNLDGTSFLIHLKKQCDTYIADGKSELVPHFTYHGFRYFSVEGEAEPVETVVLHTNVAVTSSFHCSDKTLNWLYNAAVRTLLCNMHMCVPLDCPTREKLGYTGDGQLCCETAMHLLDTEQFYLKWLCDIADAQDIATGNVPHTVPYMGGGGGIGGWGSAIVEIPYRMWKMFGRLDIVEKYLPNMMRFVSYMQSRSSHGFVTCEETGWVLGDWGFPYEDNLEILPQNYVNTYFYVKCLTQLAEICTFLGKDKNADYYTALATFSKEAMVAAYKSPMTDCFCANLSGANAFATDLGIGTDKTLCETVKKYDSYGGFDTGIFATDILIRTLFEKGKAQLAVKLLTSHKEKASYGYMMDMGATTLWEYMTGKASHNHPMFSSPVSCFFKHLLGVKQTADSYGYERVVISPAIVDMLTFCKGSFMTVKGEFSVSYEKTQDGISFEITVPENVQAVFTSGSFTKELKCGVNVFKL